MYTIETYGKFDSAHFLKDYEGKCANIHGHRWEVKVSVSTETLEEEGPYRGMVIDFSLLKDILRKETKRLDHSLIIEEGSLKEKTLEALNEEGFRIITFPFRPTAENFAHHFYTYLKEAGYDVTKVTVSETPNNKASYEERAH